MKYYVKLLFSGNKKALNGAANFVRLLDDRDFWEQEQIGFSVESNDTSYSNEEVYRKSLLFKIKSLAKSILDKSKVGKWRFIRYEFDVLGKTVADKVKPDLGTCYVLNDYMVAYNFYIKYHAKYRTVFLMHNNGDMLSMVDPVMLEDPKIGYFFSNVEKTILKCSDRIVFVSEIAKENFLVKHSEFRDKIAVINIGLKDKFVLRHDIGDTNRLVTVGTLNQRKNQIAIIKAVEKINSDAIKLTLVGGGPKLSEWRQYSESHNLTGKVHLVGAQNDVFKYLANSDVFVMSSLDEGLPVAAQEAMQMGLPLILTNVGGCKELIDGNGILLEDSSIDSLSDAICYIFSDKARRIQMGNRSRVLYDRQYSVNRMLESYAKLFGQLMEGETNGEVSN